MFGQSTRKCERFLAELNFPGFYSFEVDFAERGG
jgi:hypothetical protein